MFSWTSWQELRLTAPSATKSSPCKPGYEESSLEIEAVVWRFASHPGSLEARADGVVSRPQGLKIGWSVKAYNITLVTAFGYREVADLSPVRVSEHKLSTLYKTGVANYQAHEPNIKARKCEER